MKNLCFHVIILLSLVQLSFAQSLEFTDKLNSGLLTLEEILKEYPLIKERINYDLYPSNFRAIVESFYQKNRLSKKFSYKITDQIVSQIKYDKPDWTNNERRKYEYNSENQLIRITTQKWNGTSWVDWIKNRIY